ncbi:MAG: hypothetical protein SF182_02395 [Deltaproteobacteria bacterium]|nr:hypothetical protein [Deltaproteobacteria bacterium]
MSSLRSPLTNCAPPNFATTRACVPSPPRSRKIPGGVAAVDS